MRRQIATTPNSRGRRCPSGKTRFRDHTSAATALAVAERRSTRAVVPVRAYECPTCQGWHLTSHDA